MTEITRQPQRFLPEVTQETIELCIGHMTLLETSEDNWGQLFEDEQLWLKLAIDSWVEPMPEPLQDRARGCALVTYHAFRTEAALSTGSQATGAEARVQSLPRLQMTALGAMVGSIVERKQAFFVEALHHLKINQPWLSLVMQIYIEGVFPDKATREDALCAVLMVHEAFERYGEAEAMNAQAFGPPPESG